MSRLQSGLVARRLSIFVIFQSLNWTTILPTPWLPVSFNGAKSIPSSLFEALSYQ
jgi:hypothetical protein